MNGFVGQLILSCLRANQPSRGIGMAPYGRGRGNGQASQAHTVKKAWPEDEKSVKLFASSLLDRWLGTGSLTAETTDSKLWRVGCHGDRTIANGQLSNRELMSTENLVIEAFKDIVKDELKTHIRAKVDEDPELKAEIKEAVAYYFHSKARSIYAELKATRAATRLGLRLLPDELQVKLKHW